MRLRVVIRGAVQGVGFRPFVHRLATELSLAGWVNNSTQGVFTEVEGPRDRLGQFLVRIQRESPPRSSIQSLEPTWLDEIGFQGFEIRESDESGEKSTLILPDIATCPDCLREILDPRDRRHLYPFTNCTNCGPRFSIIESLPYDRPNTSMKAFAMCEECRAEYEDPQSRRFHAQPNACPKCGPQLKFWERGRACQSAESGGIKADPHFHKCGHDALRAAAEAIMEGAIDAVKGLGGFHLMCLASDDAAVLRLRERKQREEKPFALMFPSVKAVGEVCEVSPLEERLLDSPESPIVLLRRKSQIAIRQSEISELVAPGNPWLGVMLPYTPLHHLLLREIGAPVVATSGNLSDEPICIDEREALDRLGDIADHFLVHNRPIVRHVDDSIVRVVAGREMVLRRARGYAPLPVTLKSKIRDPKSKIVLAVGAHLKNTLAVARGPDVFVSQHIGDLETEAAFNAFRRVADDLQRLFDIPARTVVADLHPNYLSTAHAKKTKLPLVRVQHHLAHVLSCMAENELDAPVLGVSWDGTGYGTDGTVWGGEFIRVNREEANSRRDKEAKADPANPSASGHGQDGGLSWKRVASLRPFRLPGGEAAVKEPRRSALGLLHACFGEEAFTLADLPSLKDFAPAHLKALDRMLSQGLHSPVTSSVGRLFDAMASLAGLRQVTRFEGQAAMELEFALEEILTEEAYSLPISNSPQPIARNHGAGKAACPVLDWEPLLREVLADIRDGTATRLISARFHNALANGVLAVARRQGESRIALTGGCFQNRYLLERTVNCLTSAGFSPYWHQRVPPNDGGIAVGQIAAGMEPIRMT